MSQEGRLQASSNRGRYALEGIGLDLTSGNRCDLWLGGHWIAGSIEHAGKLYADDGGMCGLCVGMRVRVPV